jgi:hypothetical protein
VGLLLVVLPWSQFWEHNYFAQAWPTVEQIVTNNFVRGGISGLGIVNLVIGFSDLSGIFAARGSSGMSLDVRSDAPSDQA